MPTPEPEGHVRNISFTKLDFPKPGIPLVFPAGWCGAALLTSESPTILRDLPSWSTDDFAGEGRVTCVPLVRTLSTKVG